MLFNYIAWVILQVDDLGRSRVEKFAWGECPDLKPLMQRPGVFSVEPFTPLTWDVICWVSRSWCESIMPPKTLLDK